MAKAYDIPADELIIRLTDQLKKDKKIEPPSWTAYVKTGPHVDKIPQNRDWWYTRSASLLRKVYLHGPVSISDLRSEYGGRKQIGYRLAHHKNAGGVDHSQSITATRSDRLCRKEKRRKTDL